ncbi:MAG TPA: hypothetical protein VMZ91_02855 [Candidatus Paceibacterota bacterium]|nr:hypothetical protein [Candidatus Paceibacterota bacterium]
MEQDAYTAGQADFNLPHDVITLPSGGIFYKSKKKTIKVGYLTAFDENIIAEADFKKSIQESIVLPLLRNKIYEKDLRPEELIDGDVEAILLFLRNTSFGPEYTINVIDPITEEKFTPTVLLDELNIKISKNIPNEEGLFETTLPVSKKQVKLKILNISDKIEMERILKSYPNDRTAPSVTTRLSLMIVSLDGNTDKGHISTFIQQMPIADSKYIRRFMVENEPRLDLSRETIAPSGEKVMVDITFGVEFFRPFISV